MSVLPSDWKDRFGSFAFFVIKRKVFMSAVFLTVAIMLVYANSLSGIFLFDDLDAIPRNPTIRHIERIEDVFSPPRNSTVAARPVANFTFAINYALGGIHPRVYHITNILIHAGAALLLFGVVRRILLTPNLEGHWDKNANGFALMVALLWAVHPIQTESVTYVVQRVESLAGLFYLLTLYSSIRAIGDENAFRWKILAISSCWLGMATKETMVSSPLLVLLYDRTFVSGTFGEAWRRKRSFYLLLFGAWFLLAGLVISGSGRYNTVGFHAGISSWHYLLTQCHAIVMYLRLSVWPNPLIFDYGREVIQAPMEVLWQGILLSMLAVATGFAVWRRHALGLVGVWFFATLAPSSSFVPIVTQTMAEHRIYLPLVSVVVVFTLFVFRWAGKSRIPLLYVIALALGITAVFRNEKYSSALAIWKDTVEKRPQNPRAQSDFGSALFAAHRFGEAIPFFQKAQEISLGKEADVHNNLGSTFVALGRIAEAEQCFRRALEVNNSHIDAMCNLAWLHARRGEMDKAESIFIRVLEIRPKVAKALHGLGYIASKRNQREEALAHYVAAESADPYDASLRIDLAAILLRLGRVPDSEREYRRAVAIEPANANGWFGLGCALSDLSRWSDAVVCYERALQINPDNAEVHNNLANVFQLLGQTQKAIEHYRLAIGIDQRLVQAQAGMATVLAKEGRFAEAIVYYEAALTLAPDNYEICSNLGLAYQFSGDADKAKIQYQKALRICPEHAVTLERLKVVLAK